MNQMFIHILLCGIIILYQGLVEVSATRKCV